MSGYEKFSEEIKRFEHKWGKAPEWAYERLKQLSKEKEK